MTKIIPATPVLSRLAGRAGLDDRQQRALAGSAAGTGLAGGLIVDKLEREAACRPGHGSGEAT